MSHAHVLKPEAMGSDLAGSCPLKIRFFFLFFNSGCSIWSAANHDWSIFSDWWSDGGLKIKPIRCHKVRQFCLAHSLSLPFHLLVFVFLNHEFCYVPKSILKWRQHGGPVANTVDGWILKWILIKARMFLWFTHFSWRHRKNLHNMKELISSLAF